MSNIKANAEEYIPAQGKRIAFVSQKYPPEKGGGASRISEMSKNLADEGWDVSVLTPPTCYPFGNYARSWSWHRKYIGNNVTVHELWSWQPTSENPGLLSRLMYHLIFAIRAYLWLLMNREEFDVVVTTSPPIFTGIAGLPFAWMEDIVFVADVRDLWIDVAVDLGFISDGGIAERLSRLLEGAILRRADIISVATSTIGDSLISKYEGIDRADLLLVPNGVDTDLFEPSDSETKYPIVYTGNIGHAKDLEPFIRAMDNLRNQNVTLHLVGDGDVRPEYEQLVDEENLRDVVKFHSPVSHSEVADILNAASIGIVSLRHNESLEYCTPVKLYEYMSMELAVIGSDTPGIKSLIDEAECGITVSNEQSEIITALKTLLKDDELRKSLGENGRNLVEREYDRRQITQRFSEELLTAVR